MDEASQAGISFRSHNAYIFLDPRFCPPEVLCRCLPGRLVRVGRTRSSWSSVAEDVPLDGGIRIVPQYHNRTEFVARLPDLTDRSVE